MSAFLEGVDLLVAGWPDAGRDRGAGPRQPGAQPMNTTLLITGAIAFAGALLLAWLASRQGAPQQEILIAKTTPRDRVSRAGEFYS